MNSVVIEKAKLYKIKRSDLGSNTNPTGAIILKGATVSVTIAGSQVKPTALADVVDLGKSTISAAGVSYFSILPDFIYVAGTVTSIELVGYVAIEEFDALT